MATESGGQVTATTSLTTVTSGGSSNAKGSWVELIASTGQDCEWLALIIKSTANDQSHLIDIGTGGSGSESVVVGDIQVWTNASKAESMFFPITIASGTRISIRQQSNSISQTFEAGIHIHDDSSFGTSSSNIAIGSDTSTSLGTVVDSGGSANTKGSWVELDASTSEDVDWLCVKISCNNDNSIAGANDMLVDIGTGASSSEVALIPDIFYINENQEIGYNCCFVYKETISAGTRVSARCQSTTTDATDRQIVVSILGCNMTAPAGGGGNQGISQGLHTIGNQISS